MTNLYFPGIDVLEPSGEDADMINVWKGKNVVLQDVIVASKFLATDCLETRESLRSLSTDGR